MRKRSLLIVALILLLLGVGGWFVLADRRVRSGQASLTSLDNASLDIVKDQFNRSADRIRIVLLLSPT
jgi:hypothetical protein